jgi:hypothetical protein
MEEEEEERKREFKFRLLSLMCSFPLTDYCVTKLLHVWGVNEHSSLHSNDIYVLHVCLSMARSLFYGCCLIVEDDKARLFLDLETDVVAFVGCISVVRAFLLRVYVLPVTVPVIPI